MSRWLMYAAHSPWISFHKLAAWRRAHLRTSWRSGWAGTSCCARSRRRCLPVAPWSGRTGRRVEPSTAMASQAGSTVSLCSLGICENTYQNSGIFFCLCPSLELRKDECDSEWGSSGFWNTFEILGSPRLRFIPVQVWTGSDSKNLFSCIP